MEDTIVITNRNRDRAKLWFEREYDNVYSIHTTEDKKYVLEYVCCNYDSLPADAEDYDHIYKFNDGRADVKARIASFDPSGGPYLARESDYGTFYLKRIFSNPDYKGFLFELEESRESNSE